MVLLIEKTELFQRKDSEKGKTCWEGARRWKRKRRS